MTRRKAVLAACGVVLGAVAAAAMGDIPWDPMHRQTALTFKRPVSLPGVTLEPGTYVFELANPESGSNVVRVRAKQDYRQVYYAGFTNMAAADEKSAFAISWFATHASSCRRADGTALLPSAAWSYL